VLQNDERVLRPPKAAAYDLQSKEGEIGYVHEKKIRKEKAGQRFKSRIICEVQQNDSRAQNRFITARFALT